ncbi:MAG: acetate--CoA ligase family protein [Candidatus Aenigmatarchaeota archaeon]
MEKIKKLFEPDSVAVIGASEKEGSVGRDLIENLKDGFDGEIYPINPNHGSILGIDTYSSVKDVGRKIDLAVVAVPAKIVPKVIDECGQAGISSSIIISAGFSESGSDGDILEEELEEKRKEYEMRIIGPNCMGVLSPPKNINLSFLKKKPTEGKIAFVSQSGALGSAMLDWSTESGVGFSSFVSVGNMMDVDFGDLIEYFGQDEDTKSILLYVEGIKNPEKFMRKARQVSKNRQIFVLKSGKYSESAEAVASHTGSLAGKDEVYNSAFKRAGVTRLDDIEDFFDCAKFLSNGELPKGSNILIVTNAGGPGVLATDAILDDGGNMADLSQKTVMKLEKNLPQGSNTSNPVDVLGDAGEDRYRKAIEICSKDKGVDGILVIYTPQGSASSEDVAKAVVDLKGQIGKPILTSWIGGDKVSKGKEVLKDNDVIVVESPERAVSTYMNVRRNIENREFISRVYEEGFEKPNKIKEELREKISEKMESNEYVLTEVESRNFLRSYGIPTPPIEIAEDKEKAVKISEEVGYPVAMKVHSKDISHKSDVGGVMLGLKNQKEVEDAFDSMMENVGINRPEADIMGVTIQRMLDMDYGLIIGAKRDAIFGPVVMFGRGGRDVELYNDTTLCISPLNKTLAKDMMKRTKVYNFLKGYRDYPPVDLDELADCLVRFSYILEDFPRIKEIDINPLAVENGEFSAIDARIILKKG